MLRTTLGLRIATHGARQRFNFINMFGNQDCSSFLLCPREGASHHPWIAGASHHPNLIDRIMFRYGSSSTSAALANLVDGLPRSLQTFFFLLSTLCNSGHLFLFPIANSSYSRIARRQGIYALVVHDCSSSRYSILGT